MEFLGKLGIDIKLLIAQIINFGLLLWLLTKFLYKPIIKKIEKDEATLKEAQIQKKELEQQKNIFDEEKQKEIIKVKKKARKIIKDSENIVASITKEVYKKTNKEELAIIEQTKNHLELLRPDLEKEILNNMKVDIKDSFQTSFLTTLPVSIQKEFQNIIFKEFIKDINNLVIQVANKADISELLKNYKELLKEKNVKKDILKKKLEEKFFKKVNPVILEYAHPLTRKQGKEIENIISKKMKIKFKIDKEQNENLINGFRFEIAGIVIENNLLNIIKDATNFKK